MATTVVTTQRTIQLDTTEDCPACGGKIPLKYEGTITVRDSGKTFLGMGTEELKRRVTEKANAEAEAALKPIVEGILSRTPCPDCGQLHPTGVRRKAELAEQARKNQRILLVLGALFDRGQFAVPDEEFAVVLEQPTERVADRNRFLDSHRDLVRRFTLDHRWPDEWPAAV